MEWKNSFLPDEQIVVIKTFGAADEASSLEMAKSISQTMMQSKATRCLIDHSALISVSGTSVDIYYRPQGISNTGIPSGVKIAELVKPAHKSHFGFLEYVCRNNGFDFRVFESREPAIQWLTK
jgi:hypothetical protein